MRSKPLNGHKTKGDLTQVPRQDLRVDGIITQFLNRHKIKRSTYDLCPKVGDILSDILGSRLKVMDAIQFSPDPDAHNLVEMYYRQNGTVRTSVPFEAFCLAAGVDIHRMAGIVLMSIKDQSKLKSSLKTLIAHPDIVDATVKAAKRLDGTKEKEMLHKAVQWLPSPKGSQINFNMGGAPPPDDDDDQVDHTDIDQIFGFDNMEIEGWGNKRAKMLEGRKQLGSGR